MLDFLNYKALISCNWQHNQCKFANWFYILDKGFIIDNCQLGKILLYVVEYDKPGRPHRPEEYLVG